jgi:hypothetical protein
MTYTAYLRIYEPVSAFHEPDRFRWAEYAASPDRPRRRDCLVAEHGEALRRLITTPRAALPEQESEHAYIRRADGTTYVCPWQTRLRCLLAYGQILSDGAPLPGALLPRTGPDVLAEEQPVDPRNPCAGQGTSGMRFIPRRVHGDDDQARAALARLNEESTRARPHILASVWTVPLTWFVPFAPAERWLSLGPGGDRPSGAATAAATRALVYTTPMARARQRVARGLFAVRNLRGRRSAGSGDAPGSAQVAAELAELADLDRWLEDFHPYSLVELDYGGLVYLASDDALCGDQSVAEIRAAVDGAARGERELAVAMYKRARRRWRAFADFEQAN